MTTNRDLHRDNWFAEYMVDQWQRLKRHPDYQYFCRKYNELFDESGVAGDKFLLEPDVSNAIETLINQFHLATVYHSNIEFNPTDILLNPPIFRNHDVVQICFAKSEIDGEIVLSPIKEGHYIECRINISPDVKLDDIKEQIGAFVHSARAELNQSDRRLRYQSNMIAYNIYDLRLAKMPFSKIAHEMGIREDSARQKFRRAWELIRGDIYSPMDLRDAILQSFLNQNKLTEMPDLEPKLRESLKNVNESADKWAFKRYQNGTDINEKDLHELIKHYREHCRKCKDEQCSEDMVRAFDHWFNTQEFDFSDTAPCPNLYDMMSNKKDIEII